LNSSGNDRPGIVRDLSGSLARRGVSIEELYTEVVSAAMSANQLFKVSPLERQVLLAHRQREHQIPSENITARCGCYSLARTTD
jgi:predicted amino acid-binding ACT domain protein